MTDLDIIAPQTFCSGTGLPTHMATERLSLRPLILDDAEELAAQCNNINVARMTGSFVTPYLALSAEFFILKQPSEQRRGLVRNWAMILEGTLVGVIGLFRSKTSNPFEIGYWIGESFWGRGLMSEAIAAVMSAARSADYSHIIARVYTDNPSSRHLLEKHGFTVSHIEPGHSMSRECMVEGWHLNWHDTNT